MYSALEKIKFKSSYRTPSGVIKKIGSNVYFCDGNILYKKDSHSVVKEFNSKPKLQYINDNILFIVQNDGNLFYDMANNNFSDAGLLSSVYITDNLFPSRLVSVTGDKMETIFLEFIILIVTHIFFQQTVFIIT